MAGYIPRAEGFFFKRGALACFGETGLGAWLTAWPDA
jgi:hypothetical protein